MIESRFQSNGLLHPFSLEPKQEYYSRFANSERMRDLFPDLGQRHEMAETLFAEKWEEALVRVTKLDGTQFFID